MKEGIEMQSFIAENILTAARQEIRAMGGESGQIAPINLGLDFEGENTLFVTDTESNLASIIHEMKDEDGRVFFLGYQKE